MNLKTIIKIALIVSAFSAIHSEAKKRKPLMIGNIFPDYVQYQNGVVAALTVSIPNSFVLVNGKAEFEVVTVNDLDAFKGQRIVDNFPVPANEFGSDYKSNIVWGIRGRGLYVLDINTKKTNHFVPSHDGDDEIKNVFVVDGKAKTLYCEVLSIRNELADCYSKYTIFNLEKSEAVIASVKFDGCHYAYNDTTLLFQEFCQERINRWHLVDISKNTLHENYLSTSLTKNKFKVHWASKQLNFENRVIIGRTSGSNSFSVINWNKKLDDVTLSPLIAQNPVDYFLSEWFLPSPDGTWFQTSATNKTTQAEQILFYHVNESYPQHISLPILGGNTTDFSRGAFVNHSTLGPLFIDIDIDHENTLLVYKLNDALAYLKTKALGK